MQLRLSSSWRPRRVMSFAVLGAVITVMILLAATRSLDASQRPDYLPQGHPPVGAYFGHSAAQLTSLTVESAHPEGGFAQGAVGLSIEADELATEDLNARHRSLVALMRQLGPGVLRIGGGSADHALWTIHHEQAPAWATSVVAPPDLVRLHKLMLATGWRVILGVDFGHFDPARAASEAYFAQRILGRSLFGIEVGNEPNTYGMKATPLRTRRYNAGNYLDEFAAYSAAIEQAAPRVRLYGPDLSSQAWLLPVASDQGTPFAAITEHYYPTTYSVPKGSCKGTPVPTAPELLSLEAREKESETAQTLVSAAKLSNREARISETNDTGSCDTDGGPETSPVFASALWSLDWALRAESSGVAGINFHGRFGRCGRDTVSPICAPSTAAENTGRVVARPEYYGLLAARQLEGGRFVGVAGVGSGASQDVTAYATERPGGTITLAVENLGSSESAPILLTVPGYTKAKARALAAASLTAVAGVSFHRASLAGGRTSRRNETVTRRGGVFQVSLPPASAMIVTLNR